MSYDFCKFTEYRRKQSRITKKNWKRGAYSPTPTYGNLNRGNGRKNRAPSKRRLISKSLVI